MHSVLWTALNVFILLNQFISVQSRDGGDKEADDSKLIIDKYLDLYQLYERYSIVIPDESIVENINSPEDCAKNCYQTTAFACRSFKYCDSMKTCSLYEEHALNLKVGTEVKLDVYTACNVYASSSYLADFYNVSRNCIAGLEFTVINKTTIECAQECYALKEKCNSFNMYMHVDEPDSTDLTRCTFTELKPSNYYNTEISTDCINFEKKDMPEDNRKKPLPIEDNGGNGGNSQRTTIIIVCAVLGIAVAAAIVVFFVLRHRKNRGTSSRPN